MLSIARYLIIIIGLFFTQSCSANHEIVDCNKEFKIFDATLYENKPDLSKYGINKLTVLYGKDFWKKTENKDNLPDIRLVKKLANDAITRGDEIVVIDIEHWPTHWNKREIVNDSINKYITILKWLKDFAPKIKFGYFAKIPISNYDKNKAKPESRLFKLWQNDNNRIRPLANLSDVAFPSGYTYTNNKEIWHRSLISIINETKRIFTGPIYVFLYPQFFIHEPTPVKLRLRDIPPEFWSQQLETALRLSDGIVLWGGWNFQDRKAMIWNESALWWQETKRFIQDNKCISK